MNLSLNHTQRLNLIVLLDRLESQGRREGYAVCRLQERLDLTDQDRQNIGWRTQRSEAVLDESGKVVTPPQEYALWSAQPDLVPILDIELSDDDVGRICRALDKFPVVLGRDKSWWVPLVAQLPDKEQSNGATSAQSA